MKQICSKCKKEKELDCFYLRKNTKKHRKDCKTCFGKRVAKQAEIKRIKITENGGHDYNIIFQKKKLCPDCKKYKLGKFFYKTLIRIDGLSFRCKKCDIKYGRNRIYENIESRINKEQKETIEKECSCCNKVKPLKMFNGGKGKYSKSSMCKECKNKKVSERRNTKEGKLLYYKYEAKSRKIDWLLTDNEFDLLWQKSCSYCGDEISTIGLDRINNSLSYEINNVAPCCSECNKLKSNYEKEEWLSKMEKILNYQKTSGN